MSRNMTNSIIEHERIITTLPKAKAIKPLVEKLVTLAKNDTQHNRRRAFAQLRDGASVEKLFDVLGPRFADRPGGYCRILKLAKRRLGEWPAAKDPSKMNDRVESLDFAATLVVGML